MFFSVWTLILMAPIHMKRINLVNKWCNAKFIQIHSEKDKMNIYILDGLKVNTFFLCVCKLLFFWVNYSFNGVKNN